MNVTLLKAVIAFVPIGVVIAVSIRALAREKSTGAALQLLGAGCLVIVVLVHVCEALHLFPWMGWGDGHSVGHYLDLSSAVLGLTLLPGGYWLRRRERRSIHPEGPDHLPHAR